MWTRCVEMGKPPWHIEENEMDMARRVSPFLHVEKSERRRDGEGFSTPKCFPITTCWKMWTRHDEEGFPTLARWKTRTWHDGEGFPTPARRKLRNWHDGEGFPTLARQDLKTPISTWQGGSPRPVTSKNANTTWWGGFPHPGTSKTPKSTWQEGFLHPGMSKMMKSMWRRGFPHPSTSKTSKLTWQGGETHPDTSKNISVDCKTIISVNGCGYFVWNIPGWGNWVKHTHFPSPLPNVWQ